MILHLITDRWRLAGPRSSWERQRQCLAEQMHYAVEAGIDVVQLRERDLEAKDLFTLTTDFVALARGSRTRVVVNDRLDVALAAGAHGVHLRSDSIAPARVRAVAVRGFLIGRSVHGASEAALIGSTVDYVIAGTIWPTRSKPSDHVLLGVEGLSAVVAASAVPVLAIGGVTVDRVPTLVHTGAHGFAAIGLFTADATTADSQEWCAAMPLRDLRERVARAAHAPSPPL